MRALAACFVLLAVSGFSIAHDVDSDLKKAPSPFTFNGGTAIPIDFTHQELQLTFDVATKKATGKSRIDFHSERAGFPILDLIGTVTSLSLNGHTLSPSDLPTVSAPSSATRVRVLTSAVEADSSNTLEIEYVMESSQLTFSSTGVKIGFFMSDVGQDRGFLEQYAPSNLEFDAFAMDVSLEVRGATSNHRLFTNGRATQMDNYSWRIMFPEYFTTSSFFLHLTESSLAVEESIFKGLEGDIPVTAYSSSSSLTTSGMSRAKQVLSELESTYGPFAHGKVVIYLTSGGGGMEHCGATMTSLGALGHELTHSWFARGVMPANGNAGWVDEAVASWRDNGYPNAGKEPNRPSVNLGGYAEYKRTTPNAAYNEGATLMSEFDWIFRGQGGLKSMLRQLFAENKRKTITTPGLLTFFEGKTGISLSKIFDRYVYGKARGGFKLFPMIEIPERQMVSHHPRPFTKAEQALYR